MEGMKLVKKRWEVKSLILYKKLLPEGFYLDQVALVSVSVCTFPGVVCTLGLCQRLLQTLL